MSLLLADSGSTKTDWAWISEGREPVFFRSVGLNPYFVNEETFLDILNKQVLPQLGSFEGTQVYFYGSGCGSEENREQVRMYFTKVGVSNATIGTDLLGAARGVLQHEAGIICILGTGANAGLYDGKEIVRLSPSLGYVLGDEGSGAWLGKQLLTAYLRNEMPAPLDKAFGHMFQAGREEVLKNIYTGAQPSRYLASFAAFIVPFKEEPWINALLAEAFSLFFWRSVSHLEPAGGVKIGFTGSVAVTCADMIREVAGTFGFPDVVFCDNIMNGLITCHSIR